MPVRTAAGCHSVEQTKIPDYARSVRPKHHACTDLPQFLRPLVESCLYACTVERQSRSCATDSATDDADVKGLRAHEQIFRVRQGATVPRSQFPFSFIVR